MSVLVAAVGLALLSEAVSQEVALKDLMPKGMVIGRRAGTHQAGRAHG